MRKRQQSTQALDDDVIAHNEEIIDIIRNSTPIFRRVDHNQPGTSGGSQTDTEGKRNSKKRPTSGAARQESIPDPDFIASAPPLDSEQVSGVANEGFSSTTATTTNDESVNERSTKLKDAKKRFEKFWKKRRSTDDDLERQ